MNLSKNNPLKKAFKPPTINSTNANNDKKYDIQKKTDFKEENCEEKQYYKIFFSKDIKKKHKIFEEGVLIISPKSCQIFNFEGKKAHDLAKPKNLIEMIENSEPITFGFSCYGYYIFFLLCKFLFSGNWRKNR